MALVKLLHRFAVSERPRSMIKFVGVPVKDFYCRDVISFALSARAGDLCFRDGAPSFLQLRSGWRRPERMVTAHSNAPVTHAAAWVSNSDFSERLFSLFILEGMEPGDCAIELPLGLPVTRDGEVDLPELF